MCSSSPSQQQGVLFELIFTKNNFKKQNNNWGFIFKKNQETNISLSSSFSKISQNLEMIVLNIEFFHESIHGVSIDNIKRDVNDVY